MILLSENKEYQYIGISVEKEARLISRERTREGVYYAIPKPTPEKYGFIESNGPYEDSNYFAIEGGEEEFYKALDQWQDSENKVVKLVIIKVKK